MAGLAHLARMQRHGLLKPSAEAALLFDNKWRTDMTSFKQLKEYSRVRQRIAFDESRICESMLDNTRHKPVGKLARMLGSRRVTRR